MANHKSAAKRARQNIKISERNSQRRSTVRTAEKSLLTALANNKVEEAQKLLTAYSSKMNKAANKGLYHANTAARKISRLAKKVSLATK
ncbi:MAG: 30S ribosomal protein S20 [Bdellovibrionales bacterium]|nr:30S ribosomal protein S20 [Bdellovibrionales bacterium]